MFFGLGHPQHFFNSRASGFNLVPAVHPQGPHAFGDCLLGDGRGGRAIQNQWAKCLVQNQYFIDALAALVTQLPALFAADTMPKLRRFDVRRRETDFEQVIPLDLPFSFATLAYIPHQPLGHDRFDGGGDQKWLDAHVNQPGERARRVIGVERAEHQVPGQRSANRNFGRFQVADFPHHDHIRVLPENMAKAHREGQSNVRADGNLVDAFEFIFDRLFDGDDALLHGIDRAQERIERSGFARAGRPGHEHDAVRFDNDLADGGFFDRRETQLVQAQKDLAPGQ